MTTEIVLVYGILLISLVLFVTEKIRMDVTSLLVLCALALTGLVTPDQALSGFSNAAVITVWAMFILSEGLSKTGIANIIGVQVLRLAGQGETRMIIVIMLTSGLLSAFMNNIGVAALMLPVVLDISRRTGNSPSRLLMPLAYGSLLGGLTTLIGTPPNLLISAALEENQLEPFRLFDYTPVGIVALIAGTLFVAFLGKYFLPAHEYGPDAAASNGKELQAQYALEERTCVLHLGKDSVLIGKTLAESRLGAAGALNVIAILRGGETLLAPPPNQQLKLGDKLLVQGRLDRLQELQGWSELRIEEQNPNLSALSSEQVQLVEVVVSDSSSLAGQTVRESRMRDRLGVNLLAIYRKGKVRRTNFSEMEIDAGDNLLLQVQAEKLDTLRSSDDFRECNKVSEQILKEKYKLQERIFSVHVPTDSVLVGETLIKSRIGDAFGLRVLGIMRNSDVALMPSHEEQLEADDTLLIEGKHEDLEILRGLQQLELSSEEAPEIEPLESDLVGMVEVVLSPYASITNKTPRELNFRERYGLQVLAIWRQGRAYRSGLRDMQLAHGDALLLMGPRAQIRMLQSDKNFIVLTQVAPDVLRTERAPVAAAIMLAVLLAVLSGWLPIAIAAVAGATLMVLAGCLSMDEAYRSIEWRSIFLIAGMLPLGIALQQTGAANYFTEWFISIIGDSGPWAVILGLYLMTAVATTIIPTAALVVLMSPIVLKACADIGVSPYTGMMAVAMAASASFTSPISHPANVLVMGPGGYRFVDYVKLGVPLALVVMLSVAATLPFFWPL